MDPNACQNPRQNNENNKYAQKKAWFKQMMQDEDAVQLTARRPYLRIGPRSASPCFGVMPLFVSDETWSIYTY